MRSFYQIVHLISEDHTLPIEQLYRSMELGDQGEVCRGLHLKLLWHLMLRWRTSVIHTKKVGELG